MSRLAGESQSEHGRLDFDRLVKVELRGSKINSEACFPFESSTTCSAFLISWASTFSTCAPVTSVCTARWPSQASEPRPAGRLCGVFDRNVIKAQATRAALTTANLH
jgi:hypothetical protein